MIKNNFYKTAKIVFTGLLTTFIICAVYYFLYNLVEPKAYDFMTKHVLTENLPFDTSKQVYGSDDIVLIVIDMKSVEKYRWPWKRERYCKIFEYLNKYAHPKAIVYDAIIAAPDNENPESDKKLYNTIKNINNFVIGFMPSVKDWQDSQFGKDYMDVFSKKFAINLENKASEKEDIFSSFYTMPKDCLNAIKYTGSVFVISGAINGNISYWARDEIVRNHSYITNFDGNYYPSLSLQTFLLINNNPKIVLNDKYIEFPELNYKINQIDSEYQRTNPVKFYKLYNSGYSHINYSALDIMNSYDNLISGEKSIINPEVFKDKIVVVGANVPTGEGLNDNKSTPLSTIHPGADYQATVIDNIVHNDFVYVLPDWVNYVLTILGILLVYFLITSANLIKSMIYTGLIIGSYFGLSAVCFYNGVIINVLTPIIMFILTTISAYTNKYVIENKNKEKVQRAMGKYMSDDVMKRVVQNIDNLGLGGKKAVVTVLFADIRGFTSISERMSAQQVSEILNEYFTEMEPIITKHNGIINKFIGDAIMAVFGEPIQDENHAQNAVKCAYEMLKRVEKLHRKWAAEGKPEIEIGIGINTGEVFVGNIGSVNRMEYTVIGDTVNLASRLESYNKIYKTKMLISTAVYKQVKSFVDVLKIPEVQIRGKANKMDIYEVLKVKSE